MEYAKYLISLRDEVKRRKHSVSQMNKIFGEGNYEFINAVDTRKFLSYRKNDGVWSMNREHENARRLEKEFNRPIDEIIQEDVLKQAGEWLYKNAGGVGCISSHAMAWQRLLETNSEFAFIAEDDISFLPLVSAEDFNGVVKVLDKSEPTMALTFSYTNSGSSFILKKDSEILLKGRGLYKPKLVNPVYSTMAYFINRSAASRLLENAFPASFAPDWFDHFFENGWIQHLWCVWPYLTKPSGLPSTIMLQDNLVPGGHNSRLKALLHNVAEFSRKNEIPFISNWVNQRREQNFKYNVVVE